GESTARRASSAHTYRLLIFKDRVRIHYRTRTVSPTRATIGTASFCVAASAAEKRDYEELSLHRQQVFITFSTRSRRSNPCHDWLSRFPVPRRPEHERARF
ncbi:hypothetical protein, partial [Paraburkholderia fungorum]|uniref:hypothetical protein n=1 Tax=Paraburkholderia fungorum TaxID=134537 RepID=UPI001C3F3061